MYRDSAYRGGAAVARRFGGQGTVTVYSVCLPGGLRAKVDAFGATPADRTACAKAWVELELLRRAGASDDQVAASPAAPRHRHPRRRPPGPVIHDANVVLIILDARRRPE